MTPVAAKRAAGAAEAAMPLEELVTYRVCILAKMMDRASAAELAAYRLGVAEWRVLAQLSVVSPATVRGLAARLRVDRAEVSRAAAALVGRRLVRRERDLRDARSALFRLTEAGRALHREIMPSRVALHERLMAALTPNEAAALTASVRKLTLLLERGERVVPAPRPRRAE
jgi:DNA-binding MarR family transcriptional regulator